LALLYSPELATTAQNLIDAQQTNNTHLANISADRLRLWGIDDPQIENIRRTGQSITQLTVRSPIAGQVLRKYQVEGEYVEEGARLFDVADLSSVWIEAQVYENQVPFIKQGMKVSATTVGVPGREFQGKVALLQPHFDTASRTLRVRFDIDNASGALRPGMFATVNFQALVHNELSDKETNKVLTVPETAVIDTGNRQIVYRQASVGIFEGVEVKLGPRCGLYYPVYQGLRAGDRVVTAGSFLVDAETRLNPAAGSIYLGRSSGSKGGSSVVAARPSMMADDPVAQTKTSDNKLEKSTLSAEEEADIHKALAKLGSEDQLLAEKQRFCPIVGSRLGSMGTPIKVILQGRPVFLCCSSCRREALADPEGTLRKLEKRKQGHAPELKHDRKDH
jgi:RND family efflux transporter MFP subunit